MVSAIKLGPAEALPDEALTALMNSAFSDYVVPMHLTAADLAAMIARDDISLAASHVAYTAGAPIGIALVAIRPGRDGPRTRLAAMGVAPAGRRAGAGRALLQRVVGEARARGSRMLVLEVFAHNTPARRLYEGAGFVARRRLLGFTLRRAQLRAHDPGAVALRAAARDETLGLFAACTARERPEAAPPWQLDVAALARFGPPTALYAIIPAGSAAPTGYLVLGQGRPAAHLVHLGILPAWRRRGLATAALAATLPAHPDLEEFHLPQLVPEASSLVPFLRSLGATQEPEEQMEMALDVPGFLSS